MQSLAEEEIISIPNFFFFNMPSSCFLTDAPVLPVPDFSTLPTCSLVLNNILSNRPAESGAVAVGRALLTDWLGAKERTVVAIVKITVSAANTLMICSLIMMVLVANNENLDQIVTFCKREPQKRREQKS